jgi:two-component system, NtrC family, response regulator HydG
MTSSVLIVEDDDVLRGVLLEAVAVGGFIVEAAASAEAAIDRLSNQTFDIMLTDIEMGRMSGLDLLPHSLQLQPHLVPIVITAYATVERAVLAMKRGASDFLTKPIELDALLSAIEVAAERSRKKINRGGKAATNASGIIFKSQIMQVLLDEAASYAPLDISVLITGETGTGKELIARYLHEHSPRNKGPMIALNCAAVPETLLEAELFGHEKGSFTGAQAARQGRFEQANGGTLFLDEIGDMSLPMQSKLLRALEEREFYKVGAKNTTRVDVRVVAATSAVLEGAGSDKAFRSDLYYRLNEAHLPLPPLRERREDIPLLAEKLLASFCERAGLPQKETDPEVWPVLHSYYWPGNVRQLRNAMSRAAARSGQGTVIRLEDLPQEIRAGAETGTMSTLQAPQAFGPEREIPEEGLNLTEELARLERETLLQAFKRTGGNQAETARLLKMKRTTLVEKLKRHGISN